MESNTTITKDHPKSCLNVMKNNHQVMKTQGVNCLRVQRLHEKEYTLWEHLRTHSLKALYKVF